jgi:hypothetical protein
MENRIQGYVIAGDLSKQGKTVWKVRVNQPGSIFHKRKIIVASIHGDITLARGLNVSFILGSVNDSQGRPVLRAVDVNIVKVDVDSISLQLA